MHQDEDRLEVTDAKPILWAVNFDGTAAERVDLLDILIALASESGAPLDVAKQVTHGLFTESYAVWINTREPMLGPIVNVFLWSGYESDRATLRTQWNQWREGYESLVEAFFGSHVWYMEHNQYAENRVLCARIMETCDPKAWMADAEDES